VNLNNKKLRNKHPGTLSGIRHGGSGQLLMGALGRSRRSIGVLGVNNPDHVGLGSGGKAPGHRM